MAITEQFARQALQFNFGNFCRIRQVNQAVTCIYKALLRLAYFYNSSCRKLETLQGKLQKGGGNAVVLPFFIEALYGVGISLPGFYGTGFQVV